MKNCGSTCCLPLLLSEMKPSHTYIQLRNARQHSLRIIVRWQTSWVCPFPLIKRYYFLFCSSLDVPDECRLSVTRPYLHLFCMVVSWWSLLETLCAPAAINPGFHPG